LNFDAYSFDKRGKSKLNTQIITNKDRIYQYIKSNPGTHLRKIKKELGLAMGDTQYNLDVLEKLDLIKYRRISIYKHYYVKSISGNQNELFLAILQLETPRAIIMCILEFPGSSHKEISQNLGLPMPTIKWHILKLFEMKLINFHNEGKTIKCYLSGDSTDFIKMLKSYHPSILSRLSSRLMDVFIEISSSTILDSDNNDNDDHDNSLLAEDPRVFSKTQKKDMDEKI